MAGGRSRTPQRGPGHGQPPRLSGRTAQASPGGCSAPGYTMFPWRLRPGGEEQSTMNRDVSEAAAIGGGHDDMLRLQVRQVEEAPMVSSSALAIEDSSFPPTRLPGCG